MFVGEQSGKAEEAIELYVSIFSDSHVDQIEHFCPGGRSRRCPRAGRC